jgi:hypothetical protein
MQKNPRSEHPQVKSLNGLTVACEVPGCGEAAGYLFRTGRGPISVYCETHAAESAEHHGIELPESREKVLRAGW